MRTERYIFGRGKVEGILQTLEGEETTKIGRGEEREGRARLILIVSHAVVTFLFNNSVTAYFRSTT